MTTVPMIQARLAARRLQTHESTMTPETPSFALACALVYRLVSHFRLVHRFGLDICPCG